MDSKFDPETSSWGTSTGSWQCPTRWLKKSCRPRKNAYERSGAWRRSFGRGRPWRKSSTNTDGGKAGLSIRPGGIARFLSW